MSKRTNNETRKAKGRAPGRKNHVYTDGDATPSHCGKCGSTEREAYSRKVENECLVDKDGKPCTHVVLRYTACANCGQHRVDRSYENRKLEDRKLAG